MQRQHFYDHLMNIRRKQFCPTQYSRLCSEHFCAKRVRGGSLCQICRSIARKDSSKQDAFPSAFAFAVTVETGDAGDMVQQQSQAQSQGGPTGTGTGRKPRFTIIARRQKRDREEEFEEIIYNVYHLVSDSWELSIRLCLRDAWSRPSDA